MRSYTGKHLNQTVSEDKNALTRVAQSQSTSIRYNYYFTVTALIDKTRELLITRSAVLSNTEMPLIRIPKQIGKYNS